MTWKEVRQALLEGKTTVIIPTGGTEQNGPHVVLGKHNFIVRYTAGQIAKTLGDALVAPVLSYVPEGAITQPEGHMRFPGTLSVSDAVFANVLRFTAESMRQHGFKTIVFLGDSGGNQAVQQQVADDLNRIWQMDGVQVIQAGDYYRNNGQVDFLRKQGFTDVLIGSHAGIRDTSELMAVHSEGVRQAALKNYSQANFIEVGSDGDVSKASAALGKVLLELKIKAGVKQILKERF
jgi:creatinine amidohydrolase/Fe(II)-dependent formamide hydrolase-like protein